MGLQLQAVFGGKPIHRDAKMHLALAEQGHLMQFGILVEVERGILVAQFCNRAAELDLVLPVGGGDRKAVNRRERLGLRLQLRAALRRRQRFAGRDVFEPS